MLYLDKELVALSDKLQQEKMLSEQKGMCLEDATTVTI